MKLRKRILYYNVLFFYWSKKDYVYTFFYKIIIIDYQSPVSEGCVGDKELEIYIIWL